MCDYCNFAIGTVSPEQVIHRLEKDLKELQEHCSRSAEVASQNQMRLLERIKELESENQDLRDRLAPETLAYRRQQLEGRDSV